MTFPIKVSYFNNAYHDISDLVVDMPQFIEYVRSESLKSAITVLHQIIAEHGLKSKIYGDKKKNLPAICIHGQFKKKVATQDKKTGQVLMLGGRTNQHLSEYSNQVHLDMDKLDLERVLAYQKKLSADPYVHVHFKSPSWRGVKLSCHHQYGPERHNEVYFAFKDYIQKLLGCDPSEFDDVVRSISRLCFASYDPDAYYNPDSLPFLLPEDRVENLKDEDTLFNAGTYKIQEEHDLLPDLHRTEEQLQHIGGFDDYDTWIRVGLALKAEHGMDGYRLWAIWSSQSAKYPGDAELLRRWDGLDPRQISGATITHLAKESGWEFKRPASNSVSRVELHSKSEQSTQDTGSPEPETKPNPLLSFDDFVAEMKAPEFLVKDMMETDSFVTLIGDPGVGKSFFALSWGLSVASGVNWQDRPVKQGPVYYFAGEGKAGMKRRMMAWKERYGKNPGNAFRVLSGGWDLTNLDSVNKLYTLMCEVVEKDGVPSMIVVDTLARHFGANNENDTQSMNTFVSYMDLIRKKFQCTILVIHHTGKDKDKGGRGSTVLHGAVDCSYLVEKSESGQMTLKCLKMKDAEMPAHQFYELMSVQIRRPDGHLLVQDDGVTPVTSAVIVPADGPAEEEVTIKPKKTKDVEKKAHQAFLELWEQQAKNLLDSGYSPDDVKVSLGNWSQLCQDKKYGLTKNMTYEIQTNRSGSYEYFHSVVMVEKKYLFKVK